MERKQSVLYKPYDQRTPDNQYRNLVQTVLEKGVPKEIIQGGYALTHNGFDMRFSMQNGFPIITERFMTKKMISGAIAEHIGFLHGATTLKQLMSFGMPDIFWADWVTAEKCSIFGLEEGDLGPASYGAAWANFPMPNGEGYNQVSEQIKLMKEFPHLRTFMISPWIPYWTNRPTRKVVVAPCHGWLFITLYPELGYLNVHHVQRSADILVGLPINFIHYATFGTMLARELGYAFNELIYTIADAHIYKSQIPYAEKLLANTSPEGARFATMNFSDEAPSNFYDLRTDHFTWSDYHSQFEKYEKIPTLV